MHYYFSLDFDRYCAGRTTTALRIDGERNSGGNITATIQSDVPREGEVNMSHISLVAKRGEHEGTNMIKSIDVTMSFASSLAFAKETFSHAKLLSSEQGSGPKLFCRASRRDPSAEIKRR